MHCDYLHVNSLPCTDENDCIVVKMLGLTIICFKTLTCERHLHARGCINF